MEGEVRVRRCQVSQTGWMNDRLLLRGTGDSTQYPGINHDGKDSKKKKHAICTCFKKEVTDWLLKEEIRTTSLEVQRLRSQASSAGGTGATPGPGTEIPHAARCRQKINKNTFKKMKVLNLVETFKNQT